MQKTLPSEKTSLLTTSWWNCQFIRKTGQIWSFTLLFSSLFLPILYIKNKEIKKEKINLTNTHKCKKVGFQKPHDYFHSSMKMHSLVITGRKWRCKKQSSEKHTNTWISEWETLWANVLLSEEAWALQRVAAESCSFVVSGKNCRDKGSLSGNAIKSISFHPLLVYTDFMK